MLLSVLRRLQTSPTELITMQTAAMISIQRILLSSMKLCTTSARLRRGTTGFGGAGGGRYGRSSGWTAFGGAWTGGACTGGAICCGAGAAAGGALGSST